MKVGTIGLDTVASSGGVGRAGSVTDAAATRDEEAQRRATVSRPAELLSKLGELRDKDPGAVTEVASAVSSTLKDAASKASGDDAKKLGDLAADVTHAAKAHDAGKARAKKARRGKVGKAYAGGQPPGAAASAPVANALDAAIAKVDAALSSTSATKRA
jgi:hypothetical protein